MRENDQGTSFPSGFSYQFFIYEDDELEPKIKFSTTSIHTAIAIEELLKFKINEATKN